MENCANKPNSVQLSRPAANLPGREITLASHELFQLDGDSRGCQILPVNGSLWVTQKGDPEDYVLKPGERLVITRRGRVLVQGMPEARFRLVTARTN